VAVELAGRRGAFYVDQFHNPACLAAHEEGTGPEIWEALDGRLDAFVAIVGTGGTFLGTSRYLKRRRSGILCAAVEPAGAEVLAGKPLVKPKHRLQGTGYALIPPQWDPALADVFLAVSDEEATEWRRLLAIREGLHVGFSSGANVCAAARLLASGRLPPEATVVTILCDTGLKY
jgi:cysteine synthase